MANEKPLDQIMMLKVIQEVFHFPSHSLARILQISRPELYYLEHRKINCSSANIQKLYSTALLVQQAIQIDISKHLRNVLVNKKTLLQYFYESWDEHLILQVCMNIQEKISTATIVIPRKNASELEMQANLHRHIRLT